MPTECTEGGVLGGCCCMQALVAVHPGVDHPDVVRQVGRLLDGVESSRPAELMNDGDLSILLRQMLERGGW